MTSWSEVIDWMEKTELEFEDNGDEGIFELTRKNQMKNSENNHPIDYFNTLNELHTLARRLEVRQRAIRALMM